MSSKEKILAAVAANQPALSALPDIKPFLKSSYTDVPGKFIDMLTSIGGKVLQVNSLDEIRDHIKTSTQPTDRIVSNVFGLSDVTEKITGFPVPAHDLQDVELAIISAQYGVAENGAVWIKEDPSYRRVLPFICQRLAVVLQRQDIVATMHDAYQKIGQKKYGFATFIAGPSKTADIEQSLVLGAHGARTMTVFLVNE